MQASSPSVHEGVAEVSPGLGAKLRVVGQGALQVGRAGHLQDPAVQLEAVVHEDHHLEPQHSTTGGISSQATVDNNDCNNKCNK